MQSFPSRKLIGPTLAGLALLLILTMLWISPNATGAFQSPLPVPTGPCYTQTTGGFTLDLYNYVTNDDGTTTITYRVTNDNKKDISYAAFGLGDWTPVAPADGITTTTTLGEYAVEWTNDRGNPGFASVKYETEFDGFSQGASDYFVVTVSGFDADDSVAVQLKAGNARTTFDAAFDGAGCDKTPPPFSPLPTPTATPQGGVVLPNEPVVPECVFSPPPGGIPDEPVIPLDAYSFSEPQVVMTGTTPIEIVQWLPGSKTLMVTKDLRVEQKVSVELVNTITGEIEEIVEPRSYLVKPRWIPTHHTVAWAARGSPTSGNELVNEPGYWLRSFDPPQERQLSDNGTSTSSSVHDVSPDGKEVLFMVLPSGTQPLIWNQETQTIRSPAIDLAQWRYQKEGFIYRIQPFSPHWNPQGDKVLFQDGTWLFLYDLITGSGCEIDTTTLAEQNKFARYVGDVAWSPNGRYLLLQQRSSPPFQGLQGPFNQLLILDTYTGNAVQHVLDTAAVSSFSWAPDNQTILVDGLTDEPIGALPTAGYYLFNIHSGEFARILPGHKTLLAGNEMVTWAPNGGSVALQCMGEKRSVSDGITDRICVSQVTINP
ncbi:MAG: hypothetical protein H6642_02555 [Caldilineaceae bacterium]|nr:hypothetical protein [Caldilineaceae bacterium]